jgi:hypothetical protein
MAGALLPFEYRLPVPCLPALVTLTRVVFPVRMSRTKTSGSLFVSPRTRFDAIDVKAT